MSVFGAAAAISCLSSANRRRQEWEQKAERKKQEEARAFKEMLKRSANSAQARKRCGRP